MGLDGKGCNMANEKVHGGVFLASSGVFEPRKEGAAEKAGGAGINFTDHGGPVLNHACVQLIFWGTNWGASATPSMGAVTDAVVNMMSGPYTSALNQYRNIGKGALVGTTAVTTAVGSSPANPPNPFSDGNVSTLISNLVSAGRVPGPGTDSQLLYVVIMPPGVGAGGSFIGEHTFFSLGGTNAHFAWVTNNGTLNGVTIILSHELVESCTDPEGSAILGDAGTCTQSGWCEIGDVCTSTGVVNGVTVQSYWSQRDKACIVPTAKYEKDNKDSKDHKDSKDKENKEHKDSKDHKEFKDGAKEKDKDAKEKDAKEKDIDAADLTTQVGELTQRMDALTQKVDTLVQQVGAGKTFIRGEERPEVGGQVMKDPQ